MHTVRLSAKQQLFLKSMALLRAFVGGIGSGKSWVGAYDMVKRSKPGRLYLVTAPTYPMLSDATFRSLQELATELGVVGPRDSKTSPPPSIRLRTGAEILFRSTDNPETLRGPNLSGVWMDEASLSKQEAFDILIGRLRQGGEQGWLTATFTPKGKVHWTYKTFATGQPDTEMIHARSDENPFLPTEFVGNVRKRYTEQQSRQELGGVFVEGGGNHYYPHLWPRYADVGDAYRVKVGDRWNHYRKVDCYRLLALDWAMGKPKGDARSVAARATGIEELKGDHTAFVVADLTEDGKLFFLDVVNERIPMGSNAPRLAEVCRRWEPVVVAGDDDNLSETMLLETRRYRDIPTVKPMSIGGRNKLVRSQAAIVRAERGMMYLPGDTYTPTVYGQRFDGQECKTWVWVEVLSDQLASFTGADGEQDDIADAVAILGRLADEFKPGEDVDDTQEPVEGVGGYEGGAGSAGYEGGW
jgi:hypothetical protein